MPLFSFIVLNIDSITACLLALMSRGLISQTKLLPACSLIRGSNSLQVPDNTSSSVMVTSPHLSCNQIIQQRV